MPLSNRAVLAHCLQIVAVNVALLMAFRGVAVQAATVTVPLDAVADVSSNFNAYFSEGIAQLNMTFPGTNRQPFWMTGNPSLTYNQAFDFFPNDSAMKFGELTYDDSSLTSGSGSAAITGLALGIEKNPLDPSYINGTWLSFTTELQTYSGSVTVANGAVTGINLTASYNTTGYFGVGEISGSGTFSISGASFQVLASAHNPTHVNFNPSVAWNWSGVMTSVVTPPLLLAADFDDNDRVDSADLALWQSGMGIPSNATKSQGDADGNGSVDGADFLIWQREYGLGAPPALVAAAPVPEPAAASILAVAIAGTAHLRRSMHSGKPFPL